MTVSGNPEEIVRGCQVGDPDSFARLIDSYSGRCYGYFLRMTADRELSEELLSELFVKLVDKIDTFKGKSFEGWLFRVASNVFYDHLRQKQRDQRIQQVRREQLRNRPSGANIGDCDRRDEMQIQLAKLDADTREAIVLRYYSGLAFKEIAELRGEPIGTTLSKVHRGVKKLREFMVSKK